MTAVARKRQVTIFNYVSNRVYSGTRPISAGLKAVLQRKSKQPKAHQKVRESKPGS
jgi:hypothetical protein